MDGSPGGAWAEGDELVGRTIGHYVVESKIDKGGHGVVYLARDLRFPRKVAIKRIAPQLRADAEFHRRMLEEAEKAIRISDHRIATVHDVLDDEGETFLIMEYVPGPTLRERLRGPLDVRSFLALALECTEALAAAHRCGIVHRDVKPENYVVGPGERVKLLDLGIAKDLRPYDGDTTAPLGDQTRPIRETTTRTSFAGTTCYMSPEALLGRHVDFRSDIFSLGAMFYEMLAGSHPFRCDTQAATTDRILHSDPEPLSTVNTEVPRDVENLIGRMLAKDPAQRHATALEVVHDLVEIKQRVAEGRALEPLPLPIPPPPPPPVRRVFLIALSVAILSAAVYALWVVSRPPPLPEPKSVAVLTFDARDASADTRVLAAGLTEALEATLRRLTNPHVLDALPRQGREFVPLGSVYHDDLNRGANILLRAEMSQVDGSTRVDAELRSARDSSQLRHAHLEVPLLDGLALEEAVLRAISAMLSLDLTDDELRLIRDPRTTDGLAYGFDLRGNGYLYAAEAVSRSKDPLSSQALDFLGSDAQSLGSDASLLRAALLDSAEAAFSRAHAQDSLDAEAYLGLARVAWAKRSNLQSQEALDEIAALCQQALTIDLDDAKVHSFLGRLYAGLANRDPAAIPELERALELDPTDDDAILSLAQAYTRVGRKANVDSLYRAATGLRPNYHYWFARYGYYCFQNARYEEAARWYQRAIDLAPRDATSYAAIGAVCLYQGRYANAIPHLTTAIDLNPTPRAYSNLGTILFLMRRFAEAESVYSIAVALGKDDYMLWGNFADAYYWDPTRRNHAPEAYRRAEALAERELLQSPNDPTLLGRLAHYHAKLGDATAAGDYLQRAFAVRQPNYELLYKAAVVYEQLAMTDSALACLTRALNAGYSAIWVQDTPELDRLQSDERFVALLSRTSAR